MVYYTEKPALRLTKIYTSVKIYEKLLLSMPVKVGFWFTLLSSCV